MQIALGSYVFKPRLWVLVLVALLVFVCLQLGAWQWHKATQKRAITQALITGHSTMIALQPGHVALPGLAEALHTRTVQLAGRYLIEYQFLLDNQVEQGQAGFHVMTPFLLSDGKTAILVNRGWVAGFYDHQQLPVVETSPEPQVLSGLWWWQPKTAFRLDKAEPAWSRVQQVVDFDYLRKQLPYALPTVVLKLDPAVSSDGFVRHWDVPAGQVEKHLSYAYQWFGFALASILIGLYQMIEKR